jgi:integrase
MILLAYRHGLRASELCDLQWQQIELNAGRLHVRRSKKGTPSVHPMQGDEIRALQGRGQSLSACYRIWKARGRPASRGTPCTTGRRLLRATFKSAEVLRCQNSRRNCQVPPSRSH